ncbi:hypothetical protein HJ209_03065 [Vibrio parahaemolyticus]|nr:hypothetical protein [Vibrio parahaemolyticus]
MSWPVVALRKLLTDVQPGFASGKDLDEGTLQVRMNNVKPDGSWDWSKKRIVPASKKQKEKYSLLVGDILFNATNSAEQVGKSALYSYSVEETVCFSNHFLRLRTDNAKLLPEYLVRYLSYLWHIRMFENMVDAWVNQATVRREDFLNLEIPLPPLAEQKRIASILDKADAIRRKRQQAIDLADDFLRAVFLDMFGDPVMNPKGWDISRLPSHGTFKNGLNFSKEDSGISLRYLGVGDFKSLTTITDMQSLGRVELNECPAKDYLLKNGDLVFVRSNGNKALVGRCISVYPDDEALTFSGFCIRYRVEDSEIEPEYLNYLLRTPSMKQAMLKGGQGANIQNINQKILSSLSIPLPPLQHQQVFCEVVKKFRKTMHRIVNNKAEADTLFGSLNQKAFSGMF